MRTELADICETIRRLLEEAVAKNLADAILLSGGLDTSVVATIAVRSARPRAFTVAMRDSPALDLDYARVMARRLGLEHTVHVFDYDELREALKQVISVLRTFDPMEVRNSASVYIGLRLAKEAGAKSVMTGDASDELLAGYSFLFHLRGEELKASLRRMWDVMRFSSVPLARSLGMEARLPYLHGPFKEFAMSLDVELLIRKEGEETFGKWILRKAFEALLPREIVWRTKTPIEFGSGTTILPKLYESWVGESEFQDKKARYMKEDGVTIRDKEHLAYYEMFRGVFGPPGPVDPEARICPQCRSNVPEIASFCTTCGAYPI